MVEIGKFEQSQNVIVMCMLNEIGTPKFFNLGRERWGGHSATHEHRS